MAFYIPEYEIGVTMGALIMIGFIVWVFFMNPIVGMLLLILLAIMAK